MLSAGLDPDVVHLKSGVRLDGLKYKRGGPAADQAGWTCEVDCTGAGIGISAATASATASALGRLGRHATTMLGPFDVVVGADGLVSTSRRTVAAVVAERGDDARSLDGVALIGDARRALGAEWDLGLSRVRHFDCESAPEHPHPPSSPTS